MKSIAVPPSYSDVYYCEDENGHLQAIGKDTNEKLQYFYHPEWEELREKVKFSMMIKFGELLPRFRNRIYRILKETDDERQYVLAGMARLLDRTGIRVGSDDAAQNNKTFGLTTLNKKHVEFDGRHVDIHYHGKGNVEIDTALNDKVTAEIIDHCSELPGQRLFKYRDEKGTVHKIGSTTFNAFLKEQMDESFSAKDFRTWRFSIYFMQAMITECKHDNQPTLKSLLETVSKQSGNRPAVLQSSYIHPTLIKLAKNKDCAAVLADPPSKNGLTQAEAVFLKLIA